MLILAYCSLVSQERYIEYRIKEFQLSKSSDEGNNDKSCLKTKEKVK